ncbi:MAG: TrpB-like pyridoxal phosphate-dependent enzyme, partial [Chloroflexi bacterium]|nr:TrpB-like pyridoxal phosphate-dependent enzyme [Chloroflexota bacterium]
MDETKVQLSEREMPREWYNIAADMPEPPAPVLHPGTGQPIGPADLAPLFPMELIGQEVSQERYIPIPEEVQAIYRLWRPTPLYRARRLEAVLDTPARVFYKYEGTSPAGSHKPNTAVAQAYYNKKEGVKRLTTETGAGQWGSALAMACNFFGLECKVYMVKVSYHQKPYRRVLMETWGAQVVPSPSQDTNAGRGILAQEPGSPGSLGIAISEAVEDAASRDDTKYSLGSVLNHVLLHQTIIGQEARAQMDRADAYPDVVIGCAGGGSNFAGIAFPFLKDRFAGRAIRFIAVEPEACPSLTRGVYAYDFGDTAMMTPLVKMYTLGHTFVPASIHAGGLRYHGMAPLVSALYPQEAIEAVACGLR